MNTGLHIQCFSRDCSLDHIYVEAKRYGINIFDLFFLVCLKPYLLMFIIEFRLWDSMLHGVIDCSANLFRNQLP